MNDVRTLLERHGLRPSKRLGQHFLVNEDVLARIVGAAELSADDVVLEIGAGLGHLTRLLADAAGTVVAVELDRDLIPVLEGELAACGNVRVVHGDIMALDPVQLVARQPYKVVANLPYAITSAVLRHLLEASMPPERLVVTVQREVAERIVARDGRLSLLSIAVQFYGRPELLFRLKPGNFYPPPAVDSAVLRIDWHGRQPVPEEDVNLFFRVVRAGFSQPRKQIRNSLAGGLALSRETVTEALRAADVPPRRRPERLQLEDWARLTEALKDLL
jgi:16S rRNA (adenine1518-N6/adenine1519-N6)-dimethyltransferase